MSADPVFRSISRHLAKVAAQADPMPRANNNARARDLGVYVHNVNAARVHLAAAGVCAYCGQSGQLSRMSMDHVIPMSLGGPHCYDNVVSACRACNDDKGAKVISSKSPLMVRPLAAYRRLHGASFDPNVHPHWKATP